tara:strand:- start:209 stop:1402 length:1194 start_codon:yes stop_codon:yes gene_type:complete
MWNGAGLKSQIKGFGKGWGIREHDGMIRIHHRPGGVQKAAPLGLRWHENNSGEAFLRALEISKLVKKGFSIKAASKKVIGGSPINEEDWVGALYRFKEQKTKHDTNISEGTWNHDYSPVLKMAVGYLVGKKAPTNPADLIDLCIRDWDVGSPSRKRRTNNLCQFLSYCVERENFSTSWNPPSNRKTHIGRKPANVKTQKVDAITDEEIIFLMDGMPKTPAGARWVAAIQIMAVYGLRPVELKYLQVKTNKKTKEPYLWCSYQKRAGAGVTQPRELLPLSVSGQNWNLLWRLQNNDIDLPSLKGKGGVGDAALKYFKKRPAFKELQERLDRRGERIGSYSFRHSFSVRGHQRNIPSGDIASAMGHSLETHLRSYPWATSATTKEAFREAERVAIAKRA